MRQERLVREMCRKLGRQARQLFAGEEGKNNSSKKKSTSLFEISNLSTKRLRQLLFFFTALDVEHLFIVQKIQKSLPQAFATS